jgi:outer membrane protein assembly factor BamE
MAQSRTPLYTVRNGILLMLSAVLFSGCVYKIDIQQGNLVEADALSQVEVGMTRGAVRFLLGTPTVNDPFHSDRWDYPYYYKAGRAKRSEAEQRWIVVYFDGNEVSRIERDVTVNPRS